MPATLAARTNLATTSIHDGSEFSDGTSSRSSPARAPLVAGAVYAALEVATGKVTHELTEAHTAIGLLGFLKKVVRVYPKQELHVILDNASTHGTPDVEAWLAEHPEVHFHYMPTSTSWLNQVEAVTRRDELRIQTRPPRSPQRVHEIVQFESNSLRVDQARNGNHPLTPPDA